MWSYSPRKSGKTSLILKAFEQLPGVKTIYIDLYNIESLNAFAESYSRAVLTELVDWKKGVKSIEKKTDIEGILDIPEKIASRQGFQLCIAFDEFQEVKRIEPFLINWMRSAFQKHQHISYVFLGSKQSLMETIFADTNSPFYEFGIKIPIGEIDSRDWTFFIKEKFEKTGLEITGDTIESIIKKSGGYPHFTQYFASVVWEFLLEGSDQRGPGFTAAWMGRIIAGQSIIFQNQFDQLNRNQRKLIIAIAWLEPGDRLFSESYRKRHRLPATSTLTASVNALLKREMIHKKNGTYGIVNPVLREWLLSL